MYTTRGSLTALAAAVCLIACGPANNDENNEPANVQTNAENNAPDGPTGAGERITQACVNPGVIDGPPTQEGVQCTEPAVAASTDCADAPTIIDEDISADTTLSGCLQTSGFDVLAGATLTLSAGTTVTFTDPDAAVLVEGTIVAEGTAEEPVQLVGSATEGSWGGIRLLENSVSNSFQNVLFENGGGFDWNTSNAQNSMLVVQDASTEVSITDSTFIGSLWYAIHIADPATNVTISNTAFDGNTEGAILLPPNQLGTLPDNLAFGADQWVDVTGGDVTASQTWPACVPARFNDGVGITSDAMVTVQPGATLTFRADGNLRINQGSLNAVGEPDAAIVFTGSQDQAGSWGGIAYESESAFDENMLEYAIIENAGGFDWNTSNIQNTALAAVEQTVRLTVRNSVIRNSSAIGFYANSELAEVNFENVEFDGNAEGAATVAPNHMSAFDETSAFGDEQDVWVDGGTTSTEVVGSDCVPYRFFGLATIAADTTVTLEPGATLAFEAETGLDIAGTLAASGVEENVITLTGADDEPGAWAGLRFRDDSDGTLEWLAVENGGGFDWNTSSSDNANLNVEDAEATLALSNVTLTGSSAAGMHFDADPTLTCENVLIEDDPAVIGEFDSLEAACD